MVSNELLQPRAERAAGLPACLGSPREEFYVARHRRLPVQVGRADTRGRERARKDEEHRPRRMRPTRSSHQVCSKPSLQKKATDHCYCPAANPRLVKECGVLMELVGLESDAKLWFPQGPPSLPASQVEMVYDAKATFHNTFTLLTECTV